MPKYALEFLGMEVEVTDIYANTLQQKLNKKYWRVEHDASVETDVFYVQTERGVEGGLAIANLPPLLAARLPHVSTTLGAEIVLTPPYPFEEGLASIMEAVEMLTYQLQSLGEPSFGTRNSIHYHISMPFSLKVMKTILKLGAWLEDVFYYIGGQGYTFRGMLANNSAYCRPITSYGPPCIRDYNTKRFAQVFTVSDLLKSQTSREFWTRFGNANTEGTIERYHPARYTWLNLYSLLTHGTLEFRPFNITLNPFNIFAEICLCKAFCDTIMQFAWSKGKNLKDLPENSIYAERNKNEVIQTLIEFQELADSEYLTTDVINTLISIITKTPDIILSKRLIRSHVTDRAFTRQISYAELPYRVELWADTEVDPAVIQDIHTLRGERR